MTIWGKLRLEGLFFVFVMAVLTDFFMKVHIGVPKAKFSNILNSQSLFKHFCVQWYLIFHHG